MSGGDKTIREQTLEAAAKAVGLRGAAYGKPEALFTQIAARWSLYLTARYGVKLSLSPHDVAALMIEMKMARATANPLHFDTWVDVAGYAACAAECVEDRAEELMK